METSLPMLSAGCLAYFDTFAGLIPCKVVSVTTVHDSHPHVDVTIRLTATRGAYRRGEVITMPIVGGGHVIPRTAIRRRKYGTRIGLYNIHAA